MDPKFIPGTPEYRAWIISQLPEGFDLSQLGIPGLDDPADHQAFSRLGSCQKVMVPSSSGGILSHGALTADGTAVFTVSQHGFIDKVSLAGDRAVATLVSPPLNEFGAPEPEMFRFCDLAVGESLLCVGDFGGRLHIFRTEDGSLVHKVQMNENNVPITGVRVLPDNETVVVISNDGSVRLLNASTGEAIWQQKDAHEGWCLAVAYHEGSGGQLFTGDDAGVVKVWAGDDGQLLKQAKMADTEVSHLYTTPDGRLIVGGSGGKLLICSIEDLSIQSRHMVSDSDVQWISMSRDCSTLFTSARDHRLRVWRTEDLKLLHDSSQAGYVTYHAFQPDEWHLIGVSNNTVDIHTFCPWSTWLERPIMAGVEMADTTAQRSKLEGQLQELDSMQAYAQELLGAVIAEPLGEDPAALERMAVDGAEKADKEIEQEINRAKTAIESHLAASKAKADFVAAAEALSGDDLVRLKEKLYAEDSEIYSRAAREAVSTLEKAVDECAKTMARISDKLQLLKAAPENRARAKAGALVHAERVAARAERLKGWPHDDKLPPLEPGCKWHFFLSHFQLNGGDQCMALKQSLLEVHPEIKVWYDQDNTPTEAGMKEGVSGSETFLVFLTQGVLTRYFVQLEVRTALSLGKPVVLVHETDPRHGYAPIGDLIAEAPEDIRVIFNDSVAVPHYREREYRKVMLAKILRNAALPIPREMNLGGEGKPESATSAPQPSPVQSRQSAAVPVAAAVSEPPLGGKDSGLALAHDLRQLEKTVVEMRLRLDSLQASTAETAVDSQAVPATLPVKTVEDHQAPETTRGISELERKIEGLAGRMDALSAAANSEKSGRAMDDSSSKPGNGASELKTGLREAGARAKNLGTAVDPGEEIARLKAELNEQAKMHGRRLEELEAQLAEERKARHKLAEQVQQVAEAAKAAAQRAQQSSSCAVM